MDKLNLNLLRALHALLTCRHLTLASKKISISQSSMSVYLKQLREHFHDDLLVRGQGNIMQLTPLANSLIGKTRESLSLIETLFNTTKTFNPLISKRTFSIGMTDLLSILWTPGLIHQLEQEAPGIKLNIKHPNYLNSAEVFESGDIDLMIGMFEGVPENLKQQKLLQDEAVIVGGSHHPGIQEGKITLDELLKYPLIQFSLRETPFYNYFDRYLNQLGHDKRVSISVGQGIMPLLVLTDSNYLTLSIRQVAEKVSHFIPLSIASVPFEVDGYHCYQYWHQKDDADPGHRWLRELILHQTKNVL
ncbi:LysR family transcriptional regulator [Legionella santicrucis]|uniref:LysR family transcriptional regulator n=1 Tax=Legionella santicrucis TaxID=45074 RepID=A0A0W0Z3H6_9GAMM|nr:LysR family transcriptional regulator [Legionella santicrucis]KTD63687.1 LysR family transcriptional regulator [Legionella santicrucis]